MDEDPTDQSDTAGDISPAVARRRHARASLPTRVSSACERCRRHKSRCDPYRPCSLCIRANVDCLPLPVSQPRKNNVRKRVEPQHGFRNVRRQPNPPQRSSSQELPEPVDITRHDGRTPPHVAGTATSTTGHDVEFSTNVNDMQSSINPGEAESAIGIAHKICQLGSHHIDEHTTSAIPGYPASTSAPFARPVTTDQRIPISLILGRPFPPMGLVHSLLDEYFDAVHWFSLVVYEPKLRKRIHSIADGSAYPSQRPFLLLLAVMLAMAAWYRSQPCITDPTGNGPDLGKWSTELLKLVDSNLVELMDQPSVTAAQTCILLGSHHLYHGRPNLSFSLLGTTIKMSQALGMHREPLRGTFEDIEERKRVWWTIYTWDRFASITYGRPLGINDKDCNVNMPADLLENPSFVGPPDQNKAICYSTYQRELNKLYLIASPALEPIFGSRTFRTSNEAGDTYVTLAKQATESLQMWKRCLPSHLALDLTRDFHPDGGPSSRAHALQSLSLQLTYDSILIVLHRSLLARQIDNLSTGNSISPGRSEINSPAGSSIAQSNLSSKATSKTLPASSEVWKRAAVRTSRITELPVLAQLATDSHLVAFLAINLFNAAIVLAVMALAEPLSDTAQEVKRTITRILRLQDLLGKRSALSKQSTTVLKNVVTMLLRRESEAMLAPITGANQLMGHQVNESMPNPHMSVEDTLRLPLDATLDVSEHVAGNQGEPDLSRTNRLTESLTSVQYVLAPGDDRLPNMPVIGDHAQNPESADQSMLSNDVWHMSTEDSWDGQGIPQGAFDETHYGNVENGLYWLWDTTWNGS